MIANASIYKKVTMPVELQAHSGKPETEAHHTETDPRSQVRLGEMGLSGFAPYLMSHVVSCFNTGLKMQLAKEKLSVPKMRALAVLSVIEGPLIRDLAMHAVTEQSTLSRALDSMAEDGLIKRVQCAEDSRGVRVYLTESGREAFEKLWPLMATRYAAMFSGISETERRNFVATLQKMLENLQSET